MAGGSSFRLPDGAERGERLRVVRHVLYLIFSGGTASAGAGLHRPGLAREAMAFLAGCQAGHSGPGTAASSAAAATPGSPGAAGPAAAVDCLAGAPVACYAPRQFRVAYGITPLLGRGIDGSGQTVVLPELAQQPGTAGSSDIRQDLALFDRLFGLPAARLEVTTTLADASSPYEASNEEAGDAEMVHATAPGAAIRVILLPPFTGAAQATAFYTRALQMAPSLGGVVSVSAGLGERCFTSAEIAEWNSAIQDDQDQDVTVIASSGDFGAAMRLCAGQAAPAPHKGVDLPAAAATTARSTTSPQVATRSPTPAAPSRATAPLPAGTR